MQTKCLKFCVNFVLIKVKELIMTENQRLKQLLDYLRANKYVRNQQDFVERIGSDKSTISQVMNERISVPNGLFGCVISAFPFVNERWLRSGEGEMLKSDSSKKNILTSTECALYSVPLIPIGTFAGEVQGFSSECIELSQCEQVPSPIPGCDIAIDVSGDSMEPDFPNGCRVFCRRINDVAFIPWGNVFVLDTENGAFIKKLMPLENDDTRLLAISLNPEYPAFEVPKSSIFGLYRVQMMARGFSAM